MGSAALFGPVSLRNRTVAGDLHVPGNMRAQYEPDPKPPKPDPEPPQPEPPVPQPDEPGPDVIGPPLPEPLRARAAGCC